VSWIHHWVWLVPAVLLVAVRDRGIVQRLLTAGAVTLLLIGPGAGDDLLHRHGWPLAPLGALERECLVVVGIWAVATFVWRARRSVRVLAAPELEVEP
jgi:alpha-1,2-mannosyltransferase